MPKKITAYKAFNADWTCRGFQYEVGQTYTHDSPVEMCSSGFHACLHPLDVFLYYPAAGSRLAIVEMLDVAAENEGDTKVCGAEITICAELHLHDFIEAAVKQAFDAAKWLEKSSADGRQEAAKATGYKGAASATGFSGAASATGDSGAAMSSGYAGHVKGAEGCALFLVERGLDNKILNVWAGVAGRNGIRPNTWYYLRDGKPVEAA